jgi:Phage capsid family
VAFQLALAQLGDASGDVIGGELHHLVPAQALGGCLRRHLVDVADLLHPAGREVEERDRELERGRECRHLVGVEVADPLAADRTLGGREHDARALFLSGLFGQSMWGKPVVLSGVIGAGTALVGNFGQAAALARRGGPTVEASNSHDDYFVRDLVSIRAEMREALCVYRPAAFTVVTGLSS